ncbi:phosphoglycerate kinase [Deinococcus radiodurans R1 = ATCC 13939 = DSM 20539]|uniref:Phosphoglycerate kinase n=2 Tax=Deinococcus radiodurans TaxID=1299 RepID=PGK_DEIRA|nr:RecName: Full=Phosphoglycerate kinase [Deinococcus radiodurans R1 = ATCC 13939 = DSM 20539]AAF10913.1 phosphoglycerate kinase [Deinococcus radiodurans R1 = ATCC 13939 = DSM 20539]QEM70805.1 phosphoglycerate kinase [Deinococcus radiodurans]UDL00457.1 phosphoglycerate kinase [Deinococcus radiodurans R1 = ATCC 13939 = DSM 20539]HCE64018.1 phosphoglycerate kinase [Deinococcus radiodurans]
MTGLCPLHQPSPLDHPHSGGTPMQNLSQLDVKGKRVLVRVDYNVPVGDGVVQDDTRITASVPTIKKLLDGGASVVLMSHFGRPKNGPEDKYSLKPVAEAVSRALGQDVKFIPSLPGSDETLQAVQALRPGEVALLENVRFEAGEEKNDAALNDKLAKLGDAFVLDAFGSAHRAHSSVSGVAGKLPHAAGGLLQSEVDALGKLLHAPEHPYVVIIGGAKVSDKIKVIENLLPKVDRMLIGGGMMFTFIKARGGQIGNSLVEDDQLDLAKGLLEKYGDKLLLPTDAVAADKFAADAQSKVVPADQIPDGWMGLDIGPDTQRAYADALQGAKTVFWNGPMGVFEFDQFAAGTNAVAAAVGSLKDQAYTVVGGGDSVSAINKSGKADQIDHISTGGGASLELLEGKELPGVVAMA